MIDIRLHLKAAVFENVSLRGGILLSHHRQNQQTFFFFNLLIKLDCIFI